MSNQALGPVNRFGRPFGWRAKEARRLDLERWLAERSPNYLYSFASICQILSFDEDALYSRFREVLGPLESAQQSEKGGFT